MAEDSAQERTEQPTEKRKREFREEGRVAVSRDVLSLAVLAAGLTALALGLGGAGTAFLASVKNTIVQMGAWTARGSGCPGPAVSDLLEQALVLVVLPLGACLAAGVGASLVQTGLLWTPKPLAPKLERMNPLTRAKEMFFSTRALAELAKAVAKVVVVGAVAYGLVKGFVDKAPAWIGQQPTDMVNTIFVTMLEIGFSLLAAMVPVALLDYLFNRWDLSRRMKMTKQEVKEEFKEREGDPHVKAQRRRMMRDLNRNRMIKEIPRSDMVIVNPTHFAVAVRYRREEGDAPRVVAKGAGAVALKIRKEARKHGVPIIEDKALARALYRTTKVGQAIPKALYKAVAELLAVIYRIRMAKGLSVPL